MPFKKKIWGILPPAFSPLGGFAAIDQPLYVASASGITSEMVQHLEVVNLGPMQMFGASLHFGCDCQDYFMIPMAI